MPTNIESISRLTRDMRAASSTLGQMEARYLVDTYYQMQHERITAAHRLRAATESGEPHNTLSFFADQAEMLETQIKSALLPYVKAQAPGPWMVAQKGIGPVIAAGFLSRLELRPTAGAWWKFCGLDPTVKWEKGQKRPWNAALKRLCWLTGESFVKVSGYDDAFYGKIYRQRKEYETAKNEAGDYAELASLALTTKKYGDTTDAKKHYEAGRLPPARVHMRAARYAVKMFLSHLHHVWHEHETGSPPPKPFVIEHLGHAHHILPPPG
jgi:hypothetical protein